MERYTVIGIDLAKNCFEVFAQNHRGKKVFCRTVARKEIVKVMEQLPERCLLGMEACGSAHYWARVFRQMGYEVKLLSPHLVRPFVKGNKNDQSDAEAICEAVVRENIPSVGIKSLEQQEICALHRVRECSMKRRTALINEARGLLVEVGIYMDVGVSKFKSQMAALLDPELDNLSSRFKHLMRGIFEEIKRVEEFILELEKQLKVFEKEDENCQRLRTIPGLGLITATILSASVGDPSRYKNGRHFAASLGLVPRHRGTGGRVKIGGLSKRGDPYIRKNLIHGARSMVMLSKKGKDPLSQWTDKKKEEKGFIKAAIALANKNARMAWAILKNKNTYQPGFAVAA